MSQLAMAQADFKKRIKDFERYLLEANLGADVTCGERTMKEQAELYAKGRTAPGPKVTNAKPGESAHNYNLARDYIPTLGKHMLDGSWRKVRTYKVSPLWWWKFGRCAKKAGLSWGGYWRKFTDRPHIEYQNWCKYI
jgi:peptidoglycan L-alanyl-D-glutamate endopeptidase CwlK